MATTSSKPTLNEYAVVRLDKPVGGVRGEDMKKFDPRRMRYYVRAATEWESMVVMSQRYPGEAFAAMLITENVKPYFKEEKEAKVAA